MSKIVIPEGVTYIGTHALGSCKNLVSVELPKTITEFGTYPFYSSKNIESITFNGTKSEWNSKNFSSYNLKTNSSITKVICIDGEITL